MNAAIQFPFLINQRTQNVNYNKSIRQSILSLLLTKRGSILADRNYGSRLYLLIFEPNTQIISTLGYTFISEALEKEKRIKVQNIEIDAQDDKIKFLVNYSINQSQALDSINYSLERI